MGLLIDDLIARNKKPEKLPENDKKLQPRQVARYPFSCHFSLIADQIDPLLIVGGDFTDERFEKDKFSTGNSFGYYATTYDLDDIKIRVRESEKGAGYEWFYQWKNSMKNNDGTLKLPVEYWRPLVFNRLAPDLTTLYSLQYDGCFPTSLSDHTVAHDNREFIVYDITISVNSVSLVGTHMDTMEPKGQKAEVPDSTKLKPM